MVAQVLCYLQQKKNIEIQSLYYLQQKKNIAAQCLYYLVEIMNIGIIDVDGHNELKKWGSAFPNLVCMKIAGWHKRQGDTVEWAQPHRHYDRIYGSKVFTFKPDIDWSVYEADEIIRGGTGYDIHSQLPEEIDRTVPDYSMYPWIDDRTAYGFLTRGCPNKCPWCVVPVKEGRTRPYQTVEEIAVLNEHGRRRDHLVLMDNNVLASQYGLEQIEKIVYYKYWVDFNQAMDARLVTPEIARMLAQVKWWPYVRFGCDTRAQISHCQRASDLMQQYGYKGTFFYYCLLTDDLQECYDRVNHWRQQLLRDNKHYPHVQPYLDFHDPTYLPPRWQRDMARWCGLKSILKTIPFESYEPRKGFTCQEYFDHPEILQCRTKEEIHAMLHPHTDFKHPQQYVLDLFE